MTGSPPIRFCTHPDLRPTQWNQLRPEPAQVVGCEHSWRCPVCGWGQGCLPDPCHPRQYVAVEGYDPKSGLFSFLQRTQIP